MRAAGVKLTAGDLRCLAAGHLARLTIAALAPAWDAETPVEGRLATARAALQQLLARVDLDALVSGVRARRA
jgi:hypothetical protein